MSFSYLDFSALYLLREVLVSGARVDWCDKLFIAEMIQHLSQYCVLIFKALQQDSTSMPLELFSLSAPSTISLADCG